MKKILTLTIIAFTTFSFSQQIIGEEIDDFTKSKNITVASYKKEKMTFQDNLSKNDKIELFLYISYTKEASGNESQALLLSFFFNESTCFIQNDSKIMILLENGEIIESKSIGKTDCGKSLTGAFLLDELTVFQKNKIKKMRIYTSDGYHDIEIKEDKKDIIVKTFELLNSKINQ